MQRKALEDKVSQQNAPEQWKMKRFASVESKVGRHIGDRTDF